MNNIIENISMALFYISIAFIFYCFYYSYKVRRYVELVKDKLSKYFGNKYHYFSNPLMLPVKELKNNIDEDMQHLYKMVIKLRIYFFLAVILFILSASFIKG